MIKTRYFPYSAFWLTGQWGKGYSPPSGCATESNTFFPEFRWRPALRCTPESNYLLEGMQMKTILKLLGGYNQIIGGDISPHPPRDSAHLSAIEMVELGSILCYLYLIVSWKPSLLGWLLDLKTLNRSLYSIVVVFLNILRGVFYWCEQQKQNKSFVRFPVGSSWL